MENPIKIICNNSVCLDKSYLGTNILTNRSLFVGSVNNKSSGNNRYISILSFHLPRLQPNSIKNSYLFLYIEEIKPNYKTSYNLRISGNFEDIDLSTVNWSNLPKKSYTKLSSHIIHDYNVGFYLKIDITSLIKSLSKHNKGYNIVLIPENENSNTIIKLASSNSNYPPYLDVRIYETDNLNLSTDNLNLSQELEIETYIDKPIEKITYENYTDNDELNMSYNSKIDTIKNQENTMLNANLLNKAIDLLNNQDLKLNSYNEFLNNRINSLYNKLIDVDNRIEALDNNVSSLNSEMLKLKSIFDNLNETVKILKTNYENTDNFNQIDKFDFINSQLKELSSNLNSLIEVLNPIITKS